MLISEMSARYFSGSEPQDTARIWGQEKALQVRTILSQAKRRRLPAQIGAENSATLIWAELVDSGHLDAWITLGPDGQLCKISDARITALGREYLDGFEDEMVDRITVFPAQTFWWMKGVAVAVVFVSLLVLFSKTNVDGEKTTDSSLNHLSTAGTLSSHPAPTASASGHAKREFESPSLHKESSRLVRSLCMRSSQIE